MEEVTGKKSSLSTKRIPKKYVYIIGVIALVVIALIPSIYFYNKYQNAMRMVNDPSVVAQNEAQEVVKRVSKLIALPSEELPEIRTITDKSQLPDQPFFVKAKVGDKLPIFPQAKRAILYDPAADKILEIGPLIEATPSENQATASGQTNNDNTEEEGEEKVNIVIFNGSETTGVTHQAERKLIADLKNLVVLDKDNAGGEYETSLVIDLSGKFKSVAQDIAEAIDGNVSALPSGESKPTGTEQPVDILIIVGNNFKE